MTRIFVTKLLTLFFTHTYFMDKQDVNPNGKG